MYSLRTIGAGLLALATTSLAAAVPELIERDSTCVNGATTRSCWSDGFSVATNTDTKFPDTGKVVTVSKPLHKHGEHEANLHDSTILKLQRRQCLPMVLQDR